MATQLLSTPSTHGWSFVSTLDTVWNTVRDTLIDIGSGPASGLAEVAVTSHLKRMNHGHLRIITPHKEYVYPDLQHATVRNQHDDLYAELKVINPSFWIRLALMSDLGFAEAFMYGDVECNDLVSVFLVFIHNRKDLSDLSSSLSRLASLPQILTSYRFLNTISNSRSNISAHYDISNDMFAGFLSEDMTYSCGIFRDLDGDLEAKPSTANKKLMGEKWATAITAASNPFNKRNSRSYSPESAISSGSTTPPTSSEEPDSTDSEATVAGSTLGLDNDELYDAQMRKIRHIIRKANIRKGNRVLEIGSGWGALAIEAVRSTGCEVDTLTLSVAQKELAEQRIKAAGPEFERKIRVHLMDYRNMPAEWEGAFDRFVSVEMIEAVGQEFLQTYWNVVDWALKKKDSMGVVQVITIPEARFDNYVKEVDFIRKWIFPGGFLPTVNLLVDTLTKGSAGSLVVDSICNIGPHYARTLREWRRRFEAKFDEVIVPALQQEYPEVMGPHTGQKGLWEIEVFKRKWIYYYCYCEVGFSTRTLGDHIMTFTREGISTFGCDVYD